MTLRIYLNPSAYRRTSRNQSIGPVLAVPFIFIFLCALGCQPASGACTGTISTGALSINDALNTVGWPITYSSGTSITLSSIFLVWPTTKGNLNSVTLGGNTIWSGSLSPTSTLLSSLTGSTTIPTGTTTLQFNFQGVPGGQIIGDNIQETHVENPSAGQAWACSFTASATGMATTFNLYFDSNNAATKTIVGVYSSNGANPVTLLSSGTLTGNPKGTWSAITLSPSVSLTSGTQYWLVVLGPYGYGTVKYRDKSGGTSKRSSSTILTALPNPWVTSSTTRSYYSLSAYLTGYVSGGSTSSSDYSIRTNFACGNSIGYPSLPSLGILGSDTVCNAQNYWHNASVTNEDSRYTYSYAWKLDSQYNIGSGKYIQVNWNSYVGGTHTLQVSQTETYGSTTTYTNTSSMNVFEVPKPNPSITFS